MIFGFKFDRETNDEKYLCHQDRINSFTVDGLLGVLSKETSYKKGQCQYQDDFINSWIILEN